MDSSTVQHTLTDAEVLSFCKNGYLMYKAVVSGDINKWVTEFLEDNDPTCLLKEDRFIEHVLLNPKAGGAVRALLGENFALPTGMANHRVEDPLDAQNWHRDGGSRVGYEVNHLQVFYYPQDTTDDMGPSGILPQTQFQRFISDSDATKTTEEPLSICGAAGTVALIHFDSWHRATANTSEQNRYMLKFQFARTREPDTPTWDHRSPAWSPGIEDPHPAISQNVWDWLCGRMDRRPSIEGETLVDLADRGTDFQAEVSIAQHNRHEVDAGTELAKFNRGRSQAGWYEDGEFTTHQETGRPAAHRDQRRFRQDLDQVILAEGLNQRRKIINAIDNAEAERIRSSL